MADQANGGRAITSVIVGRVTDLTAALNTLGVTAFLIRLTGATLEIVPADRQGVLTILVRGVGERCTGSTASVYAHLCIRAFARPILACSARPTACIADRVRCLCAALVVGRVTFFASSVRTVARDALPPRIINDGAIRIDRARAAALRSKTNRVSAI